MDGYGYPYPPFPSLRPMDGTYFDHGDGIAEYYEMEPMNQDTNRRITRPEQRTQNHKDIKRSRSRSVSETKSRSSSRTRTRSGSSGTRTISQNRSRSVSRSGTRQRDINLKKPSILDTFRILYLIPSKHKKNTAKYLATKKRQDCVQEFLKSDRLGSKRWFFYPRSQLTIDHSQEVVDSRENCDQRVKVDADFFRKYKRSQKVDNEAPIRKLKRWELLFYKKLGFIQAV